jgi:gas vesicle protein
MKNKNDIKVFLATIVSAVSGAAIALLMAPEKGSKMRKKISDQSEKYLQEVKDDIAKLRQSFDKKAKSTKTELDKTGTDVNKESDDEREKNKSKIPYEEWTKEELYERAKEQNVESYSTMNKAELIKALRNEQ